LSFIYRIKYRMVVGCCGVESGMCRGSRTVYFGVEANRRWRPPLGAYQDLQLSKRRRGLTQTLF